MARSVKDLDTNTTTLQRRYVYSGTELVAELDTSGKVLRSFTWGLDVQGAVGATGGVGALLQVTWFDGTNGTTAENYFAISDANGNVSGLIRADGAIAAVYEYGALGEPLRGEISDTVVSTDPNPFQFSTGYTDAESGLVYYGRRYYAPALGRFINRDPIEEAGGRNLYGFCGNDGVGRYDVQGMGPNGSGGTTEQSSTNTTDGPPVVLPPYYYNARPDPFVLGSVYQRPNFNLTVYSDVDAVGLPFTTPNNQLNVVQFLNWRPTKRNNIVTGGDRAVRGLLASLLAALGRGYLVRANAGMMGAQALARAAARFDAHLWYAVLQVELDNAHGDWSAVDWQKVSAETALYEGLFAYVTGYKPAEFKFSFSLAEAAEKPMITVIGSLRDTEAFIGREGFNVLNVPKNVFESMTPAEFDALNTKWFQTAVNRGDEFWLVTDPIKHAELMESLGANSHYLDLELPLLEQAGSTTAKNAYYLNWIK